MWTALENGPKLRVLDLHPPQGVSTFVYQKIDLEKRCYFAGYWGHNPFPFSPKEEIFANRNSRLTTFVLEESIQNWFLDEPSQVDPI
jgi:hypothetical protein